MPTRPQLAERIIPARPEDTLLLLVGPDTRHGFSIDELANAAATLRALGYRVIEGGTLTGGAAALPIADGIARTEHWHEHHDASLLVDAGEALGKPVLGVDAWARAIGPDARAWYSELFSA